MYTDPDGKFAIPAIVAVPVAIGVGWWIYNSWQNSWERDVDRANWGPKNEYQFDRCKTPEDRDCRDRLIQLKLAYTKIKIAELLGINDLPAKQAYNDAARSYHRDCLPYWVAVPTFK